jgi:hypothetical protein
MSLSFPAMEIVRSGDALHTRCRTARTRSNRLATCDRFESSRLAHATVAVLSLAIAAWACRTLCVSSNASHCIRCAAISRSEFVMSPVGFDQLTNRFRMSSGKGTSQTNGSNSFVPLSHTPPMPRFAASQYPMYSGSPGINSLQWVGSMLATLIRYRQSFRASRRGEPFVSVNHSAFCAMAMFTGPKRPRPAGMPIAACRSFPTIFSNRFRGTVFSRRIAFSSTCMRSCLSLGNSMHRVAPSNSHPSISFLCSHRPSPCSSFFIEMLSSPLWFVTAGGGNTECTACKRLRDRCWSSS